MAINHNKWQKKRKEKTQKQKKITIKFLCKYKRSCVWKKGVSKPETSRVDKLTKVVKIKYKYSMLLGV